MTSSASGPTRADLNAIEDEMLDEFWDEVAPVQKPKKSSRRDPSKLGALFDKGHDLFYNPENWTRTRGVALFHDETQSILGNFSEYCHKTVPGCRRLVREEAPLGVAAVEHVTGDWWIGLDRKPEPPQPWFEDRVAMLKLALPGLGVWSPLCEVRAKLQHGAIARCELASETMFADPDGRALLTLPSGTNVLPVMDLEGKLLLRREIGL